MRSCISATVQNRRSLSLALLRANIRGPCGTLSVLRLLSAIMNPNTQPIIDIASEFLWGQEMQDSMAAFAANYASMFVGVRHADGEQRLEWTEAHKEFSELFEFQLEQFIGQQEFSVEEFVEACQVGCALDFRGCAWAQRYRPSRSDSEDSVGLGYPARSCCS